MRHEKRVFFSLNHDADNAVYRELLQWLTANDVAIDPWTSLDFEQESPSTDLSNDHSQLVDQIVNSDYVVVIVGDSAIDPEGADTQALNAAAWMKRPIIALNRNQQKAIDRDRFPQLIADQLVLHIPMEGQAIKHAFETWRDEAFRVRTMGQIGPVHYAKDIYDLIDETSESSHPFEVNQVPQDINDAPHNKSNWNQSAAA